MTETVQTSQAQTSQVQTAQNDRPLWRALRRGFMGRCPNCGSGPILFNFLKVHDTCPACKEELHHHRADDGPAYLTILIVGKIMIFLLHFTFVWFRPEPLVLFTIFAVGSVALALYLLPKLKGAVIAFQWSRRMGGFEGGKS